MGLAMVPEGRRIFPNLSVWENLLLGSYIRRDREEIKKDLDWIFQIFPVLKRD
jgi:branched-chain amino acid transport system ATP-binding protein